jgi:hypothetical protein
MLKNTCMKKIFLLCLAAIMGTISIISPSCKKITHDPNPTPGNIRLMGFTVTTSPTKIIPTFYPMQTVTTNYSFYYDGNNKVSQIYYSTNDSNVVKTGKGATISTFTYSGNIINKTTTLVASSAVLERDTFTVNSGLVVNANFPFMAFNFSYYGQLLLHENFTYRDSGTAVSAQTTYTSTSGNFLTRTFDGVLHATFPDSGYKPMLVFPDTVRDTVLSLPLTITWTTLGAGGAVITHTNVGAYSDQLAGYSENEVTLTAVDPNGILVRPVTFPADLGANKSYLFYGDQNRPGDYLQLMSFIIYGMNIYNNANLVKNIKSPYYNTDVIYYIDGDSKIKSLNVTKTDKFGNVYTSVYNLQYTAY